MSRNRRRPLLASLLGAFGRAESSVSDEAGRQAPTRRRVSDGGRFPAAVRRLLGGRGGALFICTRYRAAKGGVVRHRPGGM